MSAGLCRLLGMALLCLAAYEIYATILHGRSRAGPIAETLNRHVWATMRWFAFRLSRASRHRLLNAVGPVLLPAFIALLLSLLAVGYALIYLPGMPGSFHVAAAHTAPWIEALYFSGSTLLTLGYGDIFPHTTSMRFVAVFEAGCGFAIISLAVTYLLTVYGALERKRVAALSFYHQAEEGADVASFIAHHYVAGQFLGLSAALNTAARDLQAVLESHVEHPIIHYFHPLEVHKSLPRMLFLSLEICTVMRACLDAQANSGTANSPDRHTLESTSRYVLGALVTALGLDQTSRRHAETRPVEERRWRNRFQQTLARLRAAGIATAENTSEAWASYRGQRDEWESKLHHFAAYLGYEWEEITGDRDLNYAAQEEQQPPPQ